MTPSKVLFIGLGGAGQRHLRILKKLLPASTQFSAYRRTAQTPLLRSDFTVDTSNTIEATYGLKIFDSLEAAFENKPDLCVISTPSSLHREALQHAVSVGAAIIVEKPWSDSLEGFSEFRQAVLSKKLPFLISFQRRYHPLFEKTQALLISKQIGRPMAASFTNYSYVPSWHPYEDWHHLYAVRSELGGGVLLTEIHEIDLAYWFFGLPKAVFCVGGNCGAEVLSVEDTVQMILIYSNFSVQISLGFMNQKMVRDFYIAGTEGYLSWSAEANRLRIDYFSKAESEEIADPNYPNDALFEAQARKFLSAWSDEDTNQALDAAGASLAIVGAARASMQSGRMETLNFRNEL